MFESGCGLAFDVPGDQARDAANQPKLTIERAAVAAHHEMEPNSHPPCQRRFIDLPYRHERGHFFARHHGVRPQPFASKHALSRTRAR